jgi:AraC-like DNA-binding protein
MIGVFTRDAQAIGRKIAFVMNAPGDTDEDLAENRVKLQQLRLRRAELQRRIAELRAAVENPPAVPSEGEVRSLLTDLRAVLIDAAESDVPRDQETLRAIVRDLTGGKIVMTQQGERKPRRGWLRGVFRLNLLGYVSNRLGCPGPAGDGIELSIDFKKPAPELRYAAEAKRLYDQELPINEIARRLGIRRPLAFRAIKHAFSELGQSMPDGRVRRWKLPAAQFQPPAYQRIADEVMRLFNDSWLLQDIAEELHVERNLVTKSIRWWHESRGLPFPDGRTRRKTLAVKTSSAQRRVTRVSTGEKRA